MPARLLRSPWSAPSERAYWRQVAPWRQRPTGGEAIDCAEALGSASTCSKAAG